VTPGGDIPLTLVVLDELQQFIGDDTDRAHEVQQIPSRAAARGCAAACSSLAPDRWLLGRTRRSRNCSTGTRCRSRSRTATSTGSCAPSSSASGPTGPRRSRTSRPGQRRDQPAARRLRDRADRRRPRPPRGRTTRSYRLDAASGAGSSGPSTLRAAPDSCGTPAPRRSGRQPAEVAGRELGVSSRRRPHYDEQESALQQSASPARPSPAQAHRRSGDRLRAWPRSGRGSRKPSSSSASCRRTARAPRACGRRTTRFADSAESRILAAPTAHASASASRSSRSASLSAASSSRSTARISSRRRQPPSGPPTTRPTSRISAPTCAGSRIGRAELLAPRRLARRSGRSSRARGKSLVARKVRVSMGTEEPKVDPGEIPIWVRDGLGPPPSARSATKRAAETGTDSPLVLVWIPKEQADEAPRAMVEAQAAKATGGHLRAVPRPPRTAATRELGSSPGRRRAGPGAYAGPRIVAAARVFRARAATRSTEAGPATPVLGPSADPRRGQRRPAPLPGLRTGRRQPVGSRHPARERTGQPSPSPRSGTTAKWTSTRFPKAILAFLGMAGKRGTRTSAGSSRSAGGPPTAGRRTPSTPRSLALIAAGKVQARYNGDANDRQQAHPEHHGCRGTTGPNPSSDRQRTGCGQGPRR